MIAAAGALVGSPLGAKLAMAIDEKYLNYILLVAVPLIAIMVLRKRTLEKNASRRCRCCARCCCRRQSALVPVCTTDSFGPGAGTFMTLLLNSVLGLGIIRACGTTKVVNLASNVAALITYGMSGNVLVDVGIKCTIFSVLGNWVGSGLALKKGAKVVRPIMIVAMLLLLGKIASNMFLA